LLTTLYHTVGRLFPGDVLTEHFGEPSAGITIGDLIYNLHYETVNVTRAESKTSEAPPQK